MIARATCRCPPNLPEASAIVAPIHPKAMPVILTKLEEVDQWLEDTMDALGLQRAWQRGSGVRCSSLVDWPAYPLEGTMWDLLPPRKRAVTCGLDKPV
jgi:hypothetical protein